MSHDEERLKKLNPMARAAVERGWPSDAAPKGTRTVYGGGTGTKSKDELDPSEAEQVEVPEELAGHGVTAEDLKPLRDLFLGK